MVKVMDVRTWHEREFVPWREAVAKVQGERRQQAARLREKAQQLQSVVALLLDGRTKQAELAWNTLGLHPQLRELRVSDGGDVLRLVDASGGVTVLRVAELIDALEGLIRMPEDA